MIEWIIELVINFLPFVFIFYVVYESFSFVKRDDVLDDKFEEEEKEVVEDNKEVPFLDYKDWGDLKKHVDKLDEDYWKNN